MPETEAQGTEALLKFAGLLLRKGMPEEAANHLQELLRRDPGCAEAHYLLAVVRSATGTTEEAARHFQEALKLQPRDAKSWNGLGVVLQQSGRGEDAALCYRNAVEVDARYLDAHINLVLLLKDHGMLCDAERQLREALRQLPGTVRLSYNLANILQLQGRSLEAVAAYRDTLRLDPEHLDARQNLLFALHYSSSCSDRQIFQEHLAAAAQSQLRPPHECPGQPEPHHPGRRIRIGYLSPDFRGHSVASFIEPILFHHDKSHWEIFCYANQGRGDATTERLRELADHWRDIYQKGDDEAAGMIAGDRIDILVDLAGHTAGNRLPLLARKPAPLQVTWLGYPDTTGLPELDYRITDRLADPPGKTEELHTERLIRLDRIFCCYLPPGYAPPVAPLPYLGAGRITFGSFNNLAKVTPEVIALWSRVLLALPGSRLLLKCNPLADPEVRERILGEFAARGVPPGSIELHPGDPAPADHLAQYGRVDIALDTFPYNGTTTTCEALWMGVPVVTLAGTRHAARTGVSLLASCGLESLVAQSADQFLGIAVELARDPRGLQELRGGMRRRLERSPLLDGTGVTRELEAAFLGMLRG